MQVVEAGIEHASAAVRSIQLAVERAFPTQVAALKLVAERYKGRFSRETVATLEGVAAPPAPERLQPKFERDMGEQVADLARQLSWKEERPVWERHGGMPSADDILRRRRSTAQWKEWFTKESGEKMERGVGGYRYRSETTPNAFAVEGFRDDKGNLAMVMVVENNTSMFKDDKKYSVEVLITANGEVRIVSEIPEKERGDVLAMLKQGTSRIKEDRASIGIGVGETIPELPPEEPDKSQDDWLEKQEESAMAEEIITPPEKDEVTPPVPDFFDSEEDYLKRIISGADSQIDAQADVLNLPTNVKVEPPADLVRQIAPVFHTEHFATMGGAATFVEVIRFLSGQVEELTPELIKTHGPQILSYLKGKLGEVGGESYVGQRVSKMIAQIKAV